MIKYKNLSDVRADRTANDSDIARIYDITFNCLRGGFTENLVGLDTTNLRISLLDKITIEAGGVSILELLDRTAIAYDINFRANHADRAIYTAIVYSVALMCIMNLKVAPKIVPLMSSSIVGYSYSDTNPPYGFRVFK